MNEQAYRLAEKNGELDFSEEKLNLTDLIDGVELQSIMDEFYRMTGYGVGIIDLNGKVLVATGWQEICTRFHRCHPETGKNCLESDVSLSRGAEAGKVKAYKCKNNMWDLMTPVFVEGKLLANVFHGQFFFDDETVDYEFFLRQAKRYGFPEEEYLEALRKVPVRSRAEVEVLMSFYAQIATFVSRQGYCNLLLRQEMTRRSQMQEALRQAKDELEMKVEQRTREWRDLNQKLQCSNAELEENVFELKRTQAKLIQSEKMAALGNLVAGIAHEINTPLGIGVTLASHLKDNALRLERDFNAGSLTRSALQAYVAESNEAVEMLEMNLERAKMQIENFKLVAVDQAGGMRRSFRLREYINGILLSLHAKLKHTKHRIEVCCDESYVMDGYPGDFAQIITNLLLNSLLHAYDEGEAGLLRLEVRQKDENFMLFYSDDGKGMAPEVRAKIFDPFFTTKRGCGGSGLGMYIVYNIVNGKMRGEISCDSVQEKGSSFTIRLPVCV